MILISTTQKRFALVCRFGGDQNHQDFLLKRRSVSGITEEIIETFIHKKGISILLAGTKGTGKSCEGIFITKGFIDRGMVVLLEQGNEQFLIIEDQAFGKHNELVNRILAKYGEPPIVEPGVYEFASLDKLFLKLCSDPIVAHILDIGDNYSGAIDVNHPQIIISSPNSDKLKRSGEVQSLRIWYLNPWTWQELLALNERLPSPDDQKALPFVKKTADDLKELVRIFGPVPREIFKDQAVRDAAGALEDTLKGISLAVWNDILTTADYSKLPRSVPGQLVLITKRHDSEMLCDVRFASNYVARLVARRFYQQERTKLLALAQSMKVEQNFNSGLRAAILQQRMNEEFLKGSQRLEIAPLLADGTQGAKCAFDVPQLTLREFRSSKCKDLTEVRENDYCLAIAPNFTSIESFIVVQRRRLGIEEDGLIIVGLQATIAKDHIIKPRGLIDAQDQCCSLLGMTPVQLPICVIFVTTHNGIQTRQKVGRKPNNFRPFDRDFRQFVCTDIDFTEILRIHPESSPTELETNVGEEEGDDDDDE